MNDKVKLFVLAGIFFLAISGFYFLLMRNAGQTVRKHQLAKEEKQ